MRNIAKIIKEKKKINFFISYAHEDKAYKNLIRKHLSALGRLTKIVVWVDDELKAGEPFDNTIKDKLAHADIALFLLSPDFFNSGYCWEVESKIALTNYFLGETIVIPIIVRPITNWQFTYFGAILAAPDNGKPITEWKNKDAAAKNVAEHIAAYLNFEDLRKKAASGWFAKWKITLARPLGSLAELGFIENALIELLKPEHLFLQRDNAESLVGYCDSPSFQKLQSTIEANELPPTLSIITKIEKSTGALTSFGTEKAMDDDTDIDNDITPYRDFTFADNIPGFWLQAVTIPIMNANRVSFSLLQTDTKTYNQEEYDALSKYFWNVFLIFLFNPSSKLNVNLDPRLKHGGVPESLLGTQMGRNMLQQDVELKKIVSETIYPTTSLGKKFWRLYEKESGLFEGRKTNIRATVTFGAASVSEKVTEDALTATLDSWDFELSGEIEGIDREQYQNSNMKKFIDSELLPAIKQEIKTSPRFDLLMQLLSASTMAVYYERKVGQLFRDIYGTPEHPIPEYKDPAFTTEIESIHDEYERLYRQGIWRYQYKNLDRATMKMENKILISGCIEFSDGGRLAIKQV